MVGDHCKKKYQKMAKKTFEYGRQQTVKVKFETFPLAMQHCLQRFFVLPYDQNELKILFLAM